MDGRRKTIRQVRRGLYRRMTSGTSIRQTIEDNPEEVKFIEKIAKYQKGRSDRAKVLFPYGLTGSGKTFSTDKVCSELHINYYKKPPGDKWFDGYLGEEVMLLEEFRTCFTLSAFPATVDIKPPPMQIKGGFVANMAEHCVITCNLEPDEQYVNVRNNVDRHSLDGLM